MGNKMPLFDMFMLFGLNSILSNIKITTPTFLIFPLACYALVYPFIFSLSKLLSFGYSFYIQYIYS